MAAVEAAYDAREPSADPHIIYYKPESEDSNSTPHTPPRRREPPRARRTVQWPFQSTSLEDNSLPPPPQPPAAVHFPTATIHARPVTWQPRSRRIPKGFGNSTFDESEDEEEERATRRLSLIPDYIVNYLRGDTPETIARRLQKAAASDSGNKTTEADGDVGRLRGGGGGGSSSRSRGTYSCSIYHDKTWPGRHPAQRHSIHGALLSRGWRAGMALHALAAMAILVAGLVCLILALTSARSSPVNISGLVVIYSCEAARRDAGNNNNNKNNDSVCYAAYRMTWVLRAVLAACTVAILAGAQYTFQILSSPTRAEIDAAHSGPSTNSRRRRRCRRQWLDIGVPSLRNVLFLLRHNNTEAPDGRRAGGGSARLRAVLALVSITVALVTSVLYASLIDMTIGMPLTALPSTTSDALLLTNAANGTTTTTYNVTLNIGLLAVTMALNAITLICFTVVLFGGFYYHNSNNNDNDMCHAPLVTLGDAIASFLREPDLTTRGACLISKKDVVKDGLWDRMASVGELRSSPPKLSSTTTGNNGKNGNDSAVSIDSLREDDFSFMQSVVRPATQPETTMQMQPMFLASERARYFWFRSVPCSQWLVGGLVWWTLTALAVVALVSSIVRDNNHNTTGVFGFGQFALQHAVYSALSSSSSSTSSDTPFSRSSCATLVASLPQAGLAVLYFMADAHLSCYFLSHESSLFIATAPATLLDNDNNALGRRALRVSHRPRGHQTTSLYLTLPPAWRWLLLALFAGLSFATSQSLVATGLVSSDGSAQTMLLGFSATGLVVLLALLLVLAGLVLGLGLRTTPRPFLPSYPLPAQQNPLTLPGGSCSAVISARCHPSPDEMGTMVEPSTPTTMKSPGGSDSSSRNTGPLPLWHRPLAWGPVPAYRHPHYYYQGYNKRMGSPDMGDDRGDNATNKISVGHCTFSSGPLLPLDTSASYA